MEIVATNADRTERVGIVQDANPIQPDGDVYAPVIKVESGYRKPAESVTDDADVYTSAYNYFLDTGHADAYEVFERYLRIFHGTRKVTTYGPNPYTDYMYLGFDTDGWAEKVGCPDEHRSHDTLSDHRAWLEGDTYGIVLEKLETGACGHEGCEEHTAWVEEDSVWGFYGEEYAKDSATYYFPM